MVEVQAGTTPAIRELVERQRSFFNSGATRPIEFRQRQLGRLRALLRTGEQDLIQAMWEDMRRPTAEAYLGEVNVTTEEVDYALRHLGSWVKSRHVFTPLVHFPGRSTVYAEPRGVSLIISAWNYPIQQLFSPLVGSIAAGGCAILRPSQDSPRTAECIAGLVGEFFPEDYVAVVLGGRDLTHAILAEGMDLVFFTGSPGVGRIIMEAAARHLTPVVLELGGKSPCIVEPDVDLAVAARRIAWGKYFNAGQTCAAPDYAYVHRAVLTAFMDQLKRAIRAFYGDDLEASRDYARIVNDRSFDRLVSYLSQGEVAFGGERNRESRYLSPTLITNPQARLTTDGGGDLRAGAPHRRVRRFRLGDRRHQPAAEAAGALSILPRQRQAGRGLAKDVLGRSNHQ